MRRAFFTLFALVPVLGCSTTFSQRTTVIERLEDDARPGFVRDIHVRLLSDAPGVTRVEVSSLGRCAHVEERLIRNAHVATTRAHPTVVVVATAYATAAGAASGDTPLTAIGGALLIGGVVLTTLLFVGPENEDDVREHRERWVLGVRACDRRPASGVIVYATTPEGEVIAETDTTGVARMPVDRAQIVSLSLLGLAWRLGSAPVH